MSGQGSSWTVDAWRGAPDSDWINGFWGPQKYEPDGPLYAQWEPSIGVCTTIHRWATTILRLATQQVVAAAMIEESTCWDLPPLGPTNLSSKMKSYFEKLIYIIIINFIQVFLLALLFFIYFYFFLSFYAVQFGHYLINAFMKLNWRASNEKKQIQFFPH